jgi:TraX protein
MSQASAVAYDGRHSVGPLAVDNTDWLKTAAIIFVAIGHFGYFFMEDDLWWSVFGRFAAPSFFFFQGYAHSRTVPLRWIVIGVILTLLESWNADWTWVAPNILLSYVLIRIARPHVQTFLKNRGWLAFAVIVSLLLALLPVAGTIADYGAEGWLWALFGLCQRRYLDGLSAGETTGEIRGSAAPTLIATNTAGRMRLVACLVAVAAFIWQEQKEYSFPAIPLAVVILGLGVLSTSLCLFVRGKSRFQPPEKIARTLRFIGRHTLEIYAIQLAGSELLVGLVPSLSH